MTFINNNCILEKDVENWIDNEEFFAGIKNGEEVYAAFRHDKIAYSGLFTFYFTNEDKLQLILETKPNEMIKESTKHYLKSSNINHIYTKEYLKNVVLKAL